MPIYEFVCQQCDREFEELVREGQVVHCPACSSDHVRRLLSRFAIHSSGVRSAGGGKSCSSCSSAHCATCH
ncbi:MAG: zinc ribbon domain-containing protein [Actinobacteria bacterium]|nr:zinc ribbon domain-containing protein [Actinomycetota bacterium]